MTAAPRRRSSLTSGRTSKNLGSRLKNSTSRDVEAWLGEAFEDEFSDCDLLALTIKTGGPPNPGFGPGEGELVYEAGDGICPGVYTANVPEENTVDMTAQIYDDFFG